jgi:hypothetical protein
LPASAAIEHARPANEECMSEPFKIPSASIEGIDLKAIERLSPSAAKEIEHIGHLLDQGKEGTEDLIKLSELLFANGEVTHSEQILRCNILEEGDDCYQAYRRLHGTVADKEFEESISTFSHQFGVSLSQIRKIHFLRKEFESSPVRIPIDIDPSILVFLRTPCVIEFKYWPSASIADIYSKEFDTPAYLLLYFKDRTWSVEN